MIVVVVPCLSSLQAAGHWAICAYCASFSAKARFFVKEQLRQKLLVCFRQRAGYLDHVSQQGFYILGIVGNMHAQYCMLQYVAFDFNQS